MVLPRKDKNNIIIVFCLRLSFLKIHVFPVKYITFYVNILANDEVFLKKMIV